MAKALGVSLRELGAVIGISTATLFNSRSNDALISSKTLKKLEQAEAAAGLRPITYQQQEKSRPGVAEATASRADYTAYKEFIRFAAGEAERIAGANAEKRIDLFEKLIAGYLNLVRPVGPTLEVIEGEERPLPKGLGRINPKTATGQSRPSSSSQSHSA